MLLPRCGVPSVGPCPAKTGPSGGGGGGCCCNGGIIVGINVLVVFVSWNRVHFLVGLGGKKKKKKRGGGLLFSG